MAYLDFIGETAYEKPLSTSLYIFVMKAQQIWRLGRDIFKWHCLALPPQDMA
jgi:hypothetical protein